MDNNSAKIQLLNSLKQHSALPFLFIGSGMSRRYLGLPDWKGLLSNFSNKLNKPFNSFLSKADNNYPLAATFIAEAFNEYWWESDEYMGSREKFEDLVKTKEAPLKVAVSEFINNWNATAWKNQQENKIEIETEIETFKKVVVDGIITTNYDSLIKEIFPNFKEYVGQDDILLSDAQFIAESFKIHGSSENFDSLILTHDDYEKYLNRNHYLTAKLLTIFAEHPVIFLGYSITDEYIGQILNNIADAVGPNRLDELGSRIYFVEFNNSADFKPTIERTSQGHGTSQLPMTKIETYSYSWIWETLSELERPFPAALLRELKHHVFELINNPSPDQSVEAVKAVPIDSQDAEGLKVVFGVAAVSDTDLEDISSLSAKILTREDLAEDILNIRARKLDAENVLNLGITKGIKANKKYYVPTYKYLNETGRIKNGQVSYNGIPDLIKILSEKPINVSDANKKKYQDLIVEKNLTIEELNFDGMPMYTISDLIILSIRNNNYKDIENVRKLLITLYRNEINSESKTYFYRIICEYDRLVNGMKND